MSEMVDAEHAEFRALARSLSAQEWEAASLCEGWTVRDVVVHVADHVHRTSGDAVRAFVRGGMSPTRAAQRTVERERSRSVEHLLSWLDAPVRSPAPVQLAELLVHQQDIRRAVGRARDIPTERVNACLDFTLSRGGSLAVAGARRRASGITLSTTDTGWSYGANGPAVFGPAEAVLLAVNGRADALRDLSGDGIPSLATRDRP